jgi:hypothetical protein
MFLSTVIKPMGMQVFKVKNAQYEEYFVFKINELECFFEKFLYGQVVQELRHGSPFLRYNYSHIHCLGLNELMKSPDKPKPLNTAEEGEEESLDLDPFINDWRKYLEKINQYLENCEEVTGSIAFGHIFKFVEKGHFSLYQTQIIVPFMNGITRVGFDIDVIEAEKQYSILKEKYYNGLRILILDQVFDLFEACKNDEGNLGLKLSHPHIYDNLFPERLQKQEIEQTMQPFSLSIKGNSEYSMSYRCNWLGSNYLLVVSINQDWEIEVDVC